LIKSEEEEKEAGGGEEECQTTKDALMNILGKKQNAEANQIHTALSTDLVEFYLKKHTTIQGTSKPTIYILLYQQTWSKIEPPQLTLPLVLPSMLLGAPTALYALQTWSSSS
jgi:hypothetical protein